jgi:hypothetical protein
MIVYFAVLPRDGWAWLPVFIFGACAGDPAGPLQRHAGGRGPSRTSSASRARRRAARSPPYYWFTQTRLYQETRIVDLPWQEIMPALMLLLAAMMISSVPYPTWPKVGVRSAGAIGGLLLVLGIVVGSLFFPKYFLFLFGVGYLAFGLVRAVLLGLLELPPGAGPAAPPRHRPRRPDGGVRFAAALGDERGRRRRRFGRRPAAPPAP